MDVGSSLDSVETPVKQEVIEEAKLDAWRSYERPDLTAVGDDDYEYPAPFVMQGVETVLTETETLADVGVEFTAVSEIDLDPDETASPADFGFEDRTYRPTDREDRLDLRQTDTEGTISATFSAGCAETYPSIQYLAPGNPLLGRLVTILDDESDTPTRLDRLVESREMNSEVAVVRGRGRDGNLGSPTADGSVDESQQTRLLPTWLDSFLENRENASS